MKSPLPASQPAPPRRPRARTGWLVAFGLLWLALIVAGTGWMMQFEQTPGPERQAPREWPADSRLVRTPGQATLVVLAHPKCPCTRATLAELAEVMAAAHGSLTAHVLFFQPKDAGAGWVHTALWQTAAAIPGVSISADEENQEAARFGVETSGGTLLFDDAGRLLFSGGLTEARGQYGESNGRDAVVALLSGRAARLHRTPVFGCPLEARTGGLLTSTP